jgi:hypothetical protein
MAVGRLKCPEPEARGLEGVAVEVQVPSWAEEVEAILQEAFALAAEAEVVEARALHVFR